MMRFTIALLMMMFCGLVFCQAQDIPIKKSSDNPLNEKGTGEKVEKDKKVYLKPGRLSMYDFATRDSLFYSRMVTPLLSGDDPEDWTLVEKVANALGDEAEKVLSADKINPLMNQTMPLRGQPFNKIDALVTDCAAILRVDIPIVYVRKSSEPLCYSYQNGETLHLVLTSEMLELYEARPEELRFIIGRVLGQYKCGHMELRKKAEVLLKAFQDISMPGLPAAAQTTLAYLGFEYYYGWCREMEITADRAGLLCCQDPQVCFNAIQRLLSGIKADSLWIDPGAKNFNADAYLKEIRKLANQPYVTLLCDLHRQSLSVPFVPERVASLKKWSETNEWMRLLKLKEAVNVSHRRIVIEAMSVSNLANEDDTVDAYVSVYDQEFEIFNTSRVNDCRNATWRNINVSYPYIEGRPLFFEVMDDYTYPQSDEILCGYAFFPEPNGGLGRSIKVKESLSWDWKVRSEVAHDSIIQIRYHFVEESK